MAQAGPAAEGARPDGMSRGRRWRVRTLLLALVLVPTVGMVAVAATAASSARAEQRASEQVQRGAAELGPAIEALAAVANEEIASAVVTIAAELGFDLDMVSDALGVDYAAVLAESRAATDGNEVVQEVTDTASLRELREAIDAGRASFTDVTPVFRVLADDVKAVWARQLAQIQAALADETVPGELHTRIEAIDGTFLALTNGNVRATIISRLVLQKTVPSDLGELVAATARFDGAIEQFVPLLGPRARGAWAAHADDESAQRFEAVIDETEEQLLVGTAGIVLTDPLDVAQRIVDADNWASTLTDTVTAAAEDLHLAAEEHADAAAERLQIQIAVALLLTAASVAAATYIAHRVAGPIRRLEAVAHAVHQGRFDVAPLRTDGPKELARTAAAFNEMTATLATVEAHAVALADDPEADILSEELPGRTGRALQVALNRLRASIRTADQQRRELQQLATHDSLTGLLNRAAAFEMIERDLARSRREGGLVMALFIDLDGLKEINDGHGHAAGDDALRLTAEALRSNTRESDIVARLGGDEFLVAGMVLEQVGEVGQLAERLLAAVGTQSVQTVDAPIPLRCCVGVAVTPQGQATAEELVHDADSALYRAKRTGRNRVVWHDPHVDLRSEPRLSDR